MSEQVTTLFDSDLAEAEAEMGASAAEGKKLIYIIGEAVQYLKRAKVKQKDIAILLPKWVLARIWLAAPVEMIVGRGKITLFGCRVGINKESDRIFVGQEVKV